MNINALTTNIEGWAIDRRLDTADSSKQLNKLGEEFGELCAGINKGNTAKVIDSIGDMYVVLTILA
ncbi:MazG-like family protein, partial [Pantoea sp. SIMBA_133]